MAEDSAEEQQGPPLGSVLDFMRSVWRWTSAAVGVEADGSGVRNHRAAAAGVRIVGRFPGIAAGRVSEILHVHPSTLTASSSGSRRVGFSAAERPARRAGGRCSI